MSTFLIYSCNKLGNCYQGKPQNQTTKIIEPIKQTRSTENLAFTRSIRISNTSNDVYIDAVISANYESDIDDYLANTNLSLIPINSAPSIESPQISTSTGTEEFGDLDDAEDNTIVINLSDFQFSNT